MNPKFTKSQTDRNAVKNEYLKNLQLETSNNLMNYNANQIFKQTGVLPPSITALLDTRSITEKYADKQKARVAVLSGLREITDGANANQIIDQIHGNDILDLLNNLPQIIAEIKPKWSLGITAPAFISYWNNYKQALSLNAGVSTLAVLQSNQLLTNIQGLLQNIQATLPTKQDFALLKNVFSSLPQTEEVRRASQMIGDAEDDTQTVYSLATEMSIRGTTDPLVFEQQIKDLQAVMENIPPKSTIVDLTQQAQIASQLGNSPQEANYLATQVQGQLSMIQPSFTQDLRDIEAEFDTIVSTPIGKSPKPKASQESESEEEEESPSSTVSDITTETFKDTPQPQLPKIFKDTKNYEQYKRLNFGDKKIILSVLIGKRFINKSRINYNVAGSFSGLRKKNYDKTNISNIVEDFYDRLRKQREKSTLAGAQESKSSGTEPLEPTAEQIKKGGEETGTGIKRKVGRPRIMGRGVATAVAVYTKKPKVDTSHKVERVPSYIEFGKHLLHQHNLLGGILQIRRRSGNIINELPRQSIGGRLKKILITLTGTGSPSFEDINELSTHEKELLNKVVKHCKIDQRLLVPTPDKTKEEQDMNRLQILSGEITAGNNNPTIVKELKTLLLRLKNSGRIPKREAHEIMEDLLTLGY